MVALVGTTALAATALVGCGDDGSSDDGDDGKDGNDKGSESQDEDPFADQDANEVLEAGFDALADAESFRVTGTLDEDGVLTDLDVALDVDGNCTGSLESDGVATDVLGVDGDFWIKGDEQFWIDSTGDPESAALAGYWVEDPSGSLESLCTVEGFLSTFGDPELDDAEKGEVVETDAGDAIEVVGENTAGAELTVLVLIDEPHYIAGFSIDGSNDLTATDFDEPVETEEPSADELFDPSNL